VSYRRRKKETTPLGEGNLREKRSESEKKNLKSLAEVIKIQEGKSRCHFRDGEIRTFGRNYIGRSTEERGPDIAAAIVETTSGGSGLSIWSSEPVSGEGKLFERGGG